MLVGKKEAAAPSLIRTKSVSDRVEPTDGKRILVTRWYPTRIRGFSYGNGSLDLWLRDVAPAPKLLKKFKRNQISEEQFKELYIEQLTSGFADKGLAKLASMLFAGETITLLCYEKEDGCGGQKIFCHRHLLKRFVESRLLFMEEPARR